MQTMFRGGYVWSGEGTDDKPYKLKEEIDAILKKGDGELVIKTLEKIVDSFNERIFYLCEGMVFDINNNIYNIKVEEKSTFANEQRKLILGNDEKEYVIICGNDIKDMLYKKNIQYAITEAYGIELTPAMVMKRNRLKEIIETKIETKK